MLSANESIEIGSSKRRVALYKGLKVAVYNVDRPEISLTRQDLVELVNVRIFCYFMNARNELYFEGSSAICHPRSAAG